VYLAQLSLQLACLVFYASGPRTKLTFLSVILSILTTTIFIYGSHCEHQYAIRPSTVLVLYHATTIIFDAVHLRTVWPIDELQRVAFTSLMMLVPKATLSVLESWPKTRLAYPGGTAYSPEQLEGPLGRALLSWLIPLFVCGMKKGLTVHDLFPVESSMCPSIPCNHLASLWAHSKSLHCSARQESVVKQTSRQRKEEVQYITLFDHQGFLVGDYILRCPSTGIHRICGCTTIPHSSFSYTICPSQWKGCPRSRSPAHCSFRVGLRRARGKFTLRPQIPRPQTYLN
jgi:hypothetical protein